MTDTANDGGPAYPCQEQGMTSFSGQPVTIDHTGISIRDYFAAAALTGFFSNHQVRHGKLDNTWCPEYCAKQAYTLADAMLKERKSQ